MESDYFFICKSQVQGFPWQLQPTLEFCSFFFVIGCKLIDLCWRFEHTTEGQKLLNAFEYDLKKVTEAKELAGKYPGELELTEQFSEMFFQGKCLKKEERLNHLYKVLLKNKEFILGLENFLRVLMVKNNIKSDFYSNLSEKSNEKVSQYFSLRYKLAFIHFQDSKLIKDAVNQGLTFMCAINYSNQPSLLLTTQEHEELLSVYSELNFPYLFSLDWKELLISQSQSNSTRNEKNQDILDLLSEILLETELSQEELESILTEYSKSELSCENLDFLRVPRCRIDFSISEIISPRTVSCDNCHNTCQCEHITCSSHFLCDICRVKLYQEEYSSDCPICHRSYSLVELTLLNSLNT